MVKHLIACWTCLILLIAGCSAPTGPQLTKVRGVIHVDGKPASGVVIVLHPPSTDPKNSVGAISQAATDADGAFEISTYAKGDGVAPGTYNVTFTWGEFDAMTRSMKGDRLGGRYALPDKAEFQWTVDGTDDKDMGLIELTTK